MLLLKAFAQAEQNMSTPQLDTVLCCSCNDLIFANTRRAILASLCFVRSEQLSAL